MTSGVKTFLIVGGVAVGVVVLFKALSPTPAGAAKKPASNTDLLSVNGILGAATAFGKLFGGSSSSGVSDAAIAQANANSSFFAPVETSDTASQQAYALSHGVAEIEGNQLIDLNTGNALVYGTD